MPSPMSTITFCTSFFVFFLASALSACPNSIPEKIPIDNTDAAAIAAIFVFELFNTLIHFASSLFMYRSHVYNGRTEVWIPNDSTVKFTLKL